jgi:hypothetical protein
MQNESINLMRDSRVLNAALLGFALRRQEVENKIASVRALLRPEVQEQQNVSPAAPAKRRMSRAGRKRIADATRKRWAEYRAQKAEREAEKTGRRNKFRRFRVFKGQGRAQRAA